MKKSYLFIHSTLTGTKDEIVSYLNKMSTVVTWRYDMPHVFYVISQNSAEELYQEFFGLAGKKGRYMFMEASDNRQGQMLADTWHLLTHKTHTPKNT